MSHKTLNFDLFMQEKNKETMTVTLFGEDYEVPMQVPAIVPVTMARAEMSPDPAQSTMMLMKAADVLFGTETVNKLCAKGLGAPELAMLVEMVFKAINSTDDDDEQQELTDEDSRVAVGGKREKK